MAVKTYRVGSGVDGNFGALFEADQTAASRADGWTVGKIAATNSAEFDAGTKQASGVFGAGAKPVTLLTGATANAFKTPAALTGAFAATAWTFTFAVRATVASSQAGRLRMRVYRGANADGTGAAEITSAAQVGTTSAALTTTADGTTTVTWSPGTAITLNNEFLFFVLAWEITTASGSNTGDVVLRTGQAAAGSRLVTPDFVVTQTVPVGRRASATVVRGITIPNVVSVGRVGLSYAAEVLADAPAGYWRMEEAGLPQDSSGTGKNLSTDIRTVAQVEGLLAADPASKARGFVAAGGGSFVNLGGLLFPFNVFSVEVWVKRTRSGVQECLFDQYNGGLGLWINADGTLALNKSFGGTCATTAALKITDTNTHHIVVTRDGIGGAVAFYLDNVAETPTPLSPNEDFASGANNGIFIGSQWGTAPLDGTLDEVAVYPSVLSPARVAAHVAAGANSGTAVVRGITIVVALPPSFVPVGSVARVTVARGVTLAPGPVALPVGKRGAATTVRGATLAASGTVALLVGARAAATTVRGVSVVGAPLAVPIGSRAAATAVRGVAVTPGVVALPVGKRASATAVRGVTVAASGTVALAVGSRAAATAVRGVTVAAVGAAPLAIGKRAAATTTRGVTLAATGSAPLAVGRRATATAVQGVTLAATGTALLAVGSRASATSVKGVTVVGQAALVPIGRVGAATTTRGVTVVPGVVSVTVGRRASATAVRGVTLVPGPVSLALGRRASAVVVRGVTFVQGTIPVGVSLALPYAVRTVTAKPLVQTYVVRAPLARSSAFPYLVRAALGRSLVQPFTLRRTATRSSAFPYLMRTAVAKPLAQPYLIRAPVARSLVLPYGMAGRLGRSLVQPWRDLVRLPRSSVFTYGIRTSAGRSSVFPYIVRRAVGKPFVLSYRITGQLGRSLALPYAVRVRLGRSLASPYALRQTATRSLVMPYSLRFAVGKSGVLPYRIGGVLGRSLVQPWVVRVSVARASVFPYRILGLVTRPLVQPYVIMSPVPVAGVLELPFVVRGAAGASVSFPYVLGGRSPRVGVSLVLRWLIHHDLQHPFEVKVDRRRAAVVAELRSASVAVEHGRNGAVVEPSETGVEAVAAILEDT